MSKDYRAQELTSTKGDMPLLASLRRVRESQFLTREMLAARSSVSLVTIARLEAGRTVARFSTLQKLARALKVNPRLLVEEPSE
jgi:predicted transcriptional regulator